MLRLLGNDYIFFPYKFLIINPIDPNHKIRTLVYYYNRHAIARIFADRYNLALKRNLPESEAERFAIGEIARLYKIDLDKAEEWVRDAYDTVLDEWRAKVRHTIRLAKWKGERITEPLTISIYDPLARDFLGELLDLAKKEGVIIPIYLQLAVQRRGRNEKGEEKWETSLEHVKLGSEEFERICTLDEYFDLTNIRAIENPIIVAEEVAEKIDELCLVFDEKNAWDYLEKLHDYYGKPIEATPREERWILEGFWNLKSTWWFRFPDGRTLKSPKEIADKIKEIERQNPTVYDLLERYATQLDKSFQGSWPRVKTRKRYNNYNLPCGYEIYANGKLVGVVTKSGDVIVIEGKDEFGTSYKDIFNLIIEELFRITGNGNLATDGGCIEIASVDFQEAVKSHLQESAKRYEQLCRLAKDAIEKRDMIKVKLAYDYLKNLRSDLYELSRDIPISQFLLEERKELRNRVEQLLREIEIYGEFKEKDLGKVLKAIGSILTLLAAAATGYYVISHIKPSKEKPSKEKPEKPPPEERPPPEQPPQGPTPHYEELQKRLQTLGYTNDQINITISDIQQLNNATAEWLFVNGLLNLTDPELRALVDRKLLRDESIVYGNWDRSGENNFSEMLKNPHWVLDPTNSLWLLNASSIAYLDKAILYLDDSHWSGVDIRDIYTSQAIRNLLMLIDRNGTSLGIIAKNGTVLFSPRECHVGFMIASYPYTSQLVTNKTLQFLLFPAVKQIDACCYTLRVPVVFQAAEDDSPEELRKSEKYAWREGIDPAIKHVLGWIKNGDIDLSLLKNYTPVEQAQVLFPKSLCVYDMEKMERDPYSHPRLRILLANVQPSEKYNGKTPWEHWHDVAKEGFADPEFREKCFEEAKWWNTLHNWPILEQSFLEVFDNVTAQDPFCVFLMGFPYAVGVDEQEVDGFISIPASFGRPAWVVTVPYHEGGAAHGFFAVKSLALPPSGNNMGYYYQGWNGTAWEEEFKDTLYQEKHPITPPPAYGDLTVRPGEYENVGTSIGKALISLSYISQLLPTKYPTILKIFVSPMSYRLKEI